MMYYAPSAGAGGFLAGVVGNPPWRIPVTVTLIESVDWWVDPPNPMETPAYRDCRLCLRTATDDLLAGKPPAEFRAFFRVDGLDVCEHCLDAHLEASRG